MTIEQLQYFYAIYEHKTFSSAALELNITQSALSKQIAKLEQELGVLLFDRSHRQITLTDDGQKLLKDVQAILTQYQLMQEHINELKVQQNNTLKIAMLPIFSQYDFAYKLHLFQEQYPHIQVILDEIEERDLEHKFNNHDYDLYIFRGHPDPLLHCQHKLLYKDNLVAVVSKLHPLASEEKLSLSKLKDNKLLLPPQYTTITNIALEACHQAGFEPHIIRYGRLETILTAASENDGIALVMKKSLPVFHFHKVKIIPLQENIDGHIYLYFSKHHKAIVDDFIHILQPHPYQKAV